MWRPRSGTRSALRFRRRSRRSCSRATLAAKPAAVSTSIEPVMEPANVDLVRRLYNEFNETLELPRWALSDDVDWQPPADEPDNGPRHGVDAVRAYVREWASSFDDYRCTID